MEFIVIAAVIGVVWFVLSGNYKTKMQDPSTLRPSELEDSIIELKKKILVTSAYESSAEYERLYYRLKSLMGQVLERHKHFVLDAEAKGLPSYGFFVSSPYYDSVGMTKQSHKLPKDIDVSRFDPALLIYACFFIWHGGQSKDVGSIDGDPQLMLKILDQLIEEKNYGPALFMKGMVKKYGLDVYESPRVSRRLQLWRMEP